MQLVFIGIRIAKNLRLCVIILEEENHQNVIEPSEMEAAIEFAKKAFYEGANVRLEVLGFHKVQGPSPRNNLDVNMDEGAVWDELFLPGGYFEIAASGYCFDEAVFRLIMIGAPVVVFVTRSVRGQSTGCSLITFTNYVTIERWTFRGNTADVTVLAHEIGHACSLFHVYDDPNNLMSPNSTAPLMGGAQRGGALTGGQRILFRNSRHVTFF